MKGQKRAKSSPKKRSKKRRAAANPPAKRKKARSAAQKAATRRMLAARAGASKALRARRAPGAKKRKAKKRASASNPSVARASASNPKRSKKRSSKSKLRGSKRRSRRNPGIPTWALAGLAAVAGLATYSVFGAGSFALTQRLDPSMGTLERNRYIAGGLATALGLGLTFVSPVIGAGIMAGGMVGLAGTDLYLAIGKVIDKKPEPAKAIAGLYDGGNQRLIDGLYDGGNQRLIDGLYAGGGQQQFINGLGGLYDAGQFAGSAYYS